MDESSGQWMAQLEMIESLEYDHASLSSESFSSCTSEDPDLFGKLNKDGFIGPSIHNLHPHPLFTVHSNKLIKPKVEIMGYEAINTNPNQYQTYPATNHNKKKRTRSVASTLPELPSPDHIVAERRRRQKLSEKLISLSALIPSLKKMDNASVLGEAVKYLKDLKERVITLEEQLIQQRNLLQSVVVKKSYFSMDEDHDDDDATSSSCHHDDNQIENPELGAQESAFPEIEARVMDNKVLLVIHCEKRQGLLGKILNEIEKLRLSVTNASSMPFGNYDLIITITSQMEADFCVTTKDIISKLQTVFSSDNAYLC